MRETSSGFGRVLVAVYAVFAVSAVARSTYQLVSRAGEAPVAYGLSAAAGLVYVAATVGLARGWRTFATAMIAVELAGVVVVGLLSDLDGGLFGDETVWSHFGQGYGYVPMVLPVVGLWWVWWTGRRTD